MYAGVPSFFCFGVRGEFSGFYFRGFGAVPLAWVWKKYLRRRKPAWGFGACDIVHIQVNGRYDKMFGRCDTVST